jgi:phosphate transport system substrate-binding protein
MRKLITTSVLCALLMAAVSGNVQANEPNESNSVQKIVISGTGDSFELMQAIAKTMMTKFDGEVEIGESIGSTAGIKAVITGKADMARVARPLKESEQKHGLVYQVFAETPVAFVVHSGINDINNITSEQILGIYSGKITDWSQLGARPGKIYPLTREPGDSALRVLNEMLPGFADVNSPNAKVMFLTPEAVTALQEHKQTIGFVPLSAVIHTNLKILKVNGIEPSIENIIDKKYKFVIPLGIVYKEKPDGLIKTFIDLLHSEEAQKIIRATGAAPVRQQQVEN